ncbi:hypothetical protein [Streptomyces sp. NPDC050534]|uniref:hypothetical protein n=1 Tax=Streptomyces sp. NPDC050534 TaxID=3365625 RepID=UPI0037B9CBE9
MNEGTNRTRRISNSTSGTSVMVRMALSTLGYDAVDFGPLADSWRSQPGAPVHVQPCMAERPEGLRAEEVQRWFVETPGVPVPATRVGELIGGAVR